MKRIVASVLFFTVSMVCASAVFAGGNKDAGGTTGNIKIGAIYPLTGPVAAIGQNIKRGVDYAVDEINNKGGIGGRKLEIVYGDSQGDPKIGMSVAEKLITQDNVCAIIGCYQSAVTEVVSQVAERNRTPMLTAISTADQLTTHGYKYFFRLAPTNSIFLRSMIDYLISVDKETKTKIKSISIVADNTLMGQETAKWAKYWAAQHNLEVKTEVLYSQGAADLTSEVLTLKNSGADALVADCYISDAILLTKTMAEQGYKPAVMVGKATGFIDPTFIPNTGGLSNGISTGQEWGPDLTKGHEVNQGFKAKYTIDMNGHSAESYTGIWILKTAIEKAGSVNRDAIRDALKNTKIEKAFPGGNEIILPYDSISFEDVVWQGISHMNTNANAIVALAQIQNGKLVTVWPFQYTKNRPIVPAPFK
jgi:branched-chain amino acid transport system substrate-binding protein